MSSEANPNRWDPRVRVVFTLFLLFLAPPAIAVLLYSYSPFTLLDRVPKWLLAISLPFISPALIATLIFIGNIKEKKRLAELGAQFPPALPGGKWPGNIDLIVHFLNVFSNGYVGDTAWIPSEELGGVFDEYVLWSHNLVITSPEYMKIVLSTDFSNYVKGANFRSLAFDILGNGIFNSNGDVWKTHRAMTRPFLTKDRVSDFEMLDRHADHAIFKLKERFSSGMAVDFQDLISRFTLDAATEFLLGSCVDSLSSELPYPHSAPQAIHANNKTPAEGFSKAFAEAQVTVGRRLRRSILWPLFEFFRYDTEEPMKVVNAYIEPILRQALERSAVSTTDEKDISKVGEEETLLDYLVKHTKDPLVLRDETLNILVAGRDTTASTLTFIVYFLSTHPEVMTRLRQEILDRVGSSSRPTYDDIREMKYLRAVINETLRLYPPVPINLRKVVNDTTWPNPDPTQKPLYVPAGTSVTYSPIVMHRNKRLWGPDAEKFDPDRFLDERLHKYLVPNPFIFLPFNGGPRICLGQQFAYNEISFFIIRLLQNFTDIELDPQAQPEWSKPPAEWKTIACGRRKGIEKIFPKVHLTLYCHGGLWVKMNEAEK
ncbi:cytochrome P450 [Abortiporus biennis]|nr:cytochrome P450 [Abortiporus biennis]